MPFGLMTATQWHTWSLAYRLFFLPRNFVGDLEKATELACDEHEKFLGHQWLGQALVKRGETEGERERFQSALANALLESVQEA